MVHALWRRPAVVVGAIIAAVITVVVVVFAAVRPWSKTQKTAVDLTSFPVGFMIGTASSAYQIEGAWDEDGKGESIWDVFTHNKSVAIADGSNGDVACDSYHLFTDDVAMVQELGVDIYRFSVSWSRILPTGLSSETNQAGVDYYHSLIDALVAAGVQPAVTIYHWDLPQALQLMGGWTNASMADYFADFCDVCFHEYGNKVKLWVTINEFNLIRLGYGGITLAPALGDHGVSDYLASHHLLRGHAKAYRLYRQKYWPTQNGSVGVALHAYNIIPLNSSSEDDIAAADRANQFQVGIYLHPIFSLEGDYPAVVRSRVDHNSQLEGRNTSRLPSFTAQELKDLKGSADFLGINHYFTKTATSGLKGDDPSFDRDSGAITSVNTAPPEGFRTVLNWMRLQYHNPPLLVTENGCDSQLGLEDTDRVQFLHDFMYNMLLAKYTDGCNIIGYIVWSLMDDFEWYSGYTNKYGLYQVDFNATAKTRTMKLSAKYLQRLLQNRRLPSTNFTIS